MKRIMLIIMLTVVSATVFAATQNVTLSVPGMTCPVCPITVKKALNQVSGVISTEVDFDKREARISFDDAKTNVTALMEATKNAGYPSTEKTSK